MKKYYLTKFSPLFLKKLYSLVLLGISFSLFATVRYNGLTQALTFSEADASASFLLPTIAPVPGACGSEITVTNASDAISSDGSLQISNLSDGSKVRVISVNNGFDTGLNDQTFPYVINNLKPGIYAIQVQSQGCEEVKSTTIGPCGQVVIDTVQVSGCYPNNGSKATVSVQVSWTGAADSIAVTIGDQTKYIRASIAANANLLTPLSPAVLSFEFPADGSSRVAKAFFVNHPECAENQATFTLPFPCEPSTCTSLGGIVFNDYNGNGTKDTKESNGVRGVVVKAYATDGSVFSSFTDIYGYYNINAPLSKYPLRVEFTSIPSYLADGTSTPYGKDNHTTVQFVTSPNCNINIGVNNRNDFCQADPLVVVPCWVRGNPLASTVDSPYNPATLDALVAFPSSNRGVPERAGNAPVIHLALAGQVGTMWGAAYNKYTRRLFTSAVLRRHAGLGPLGLGGIYVSDMTKSDTSATRPFLDVATLGIDVGAISGRQLIAELNDPAFEKNRDSLAFFLIGKVGMGDLEISEDGNTLWFINLKDKKLYSIDIKAYNADGVTKPTAADVNSYTIPDPGCEGGEMRPWGIKVREGKIYMGVVCDGSTSGERKNLTATIFQFDPSFGSDPVAFTPIFQLPLTYPKGSPFRDPIDPATNGWFTWSDDFNVTKVGDAHPTPFVADIEFDIDGSMVLTLGDRTSLQMGGDSEASPDGNSRAQNFVGGDILRVSAVGGAFVLENNAKAGAFTGSSPDNYQGPGFGEFYNDDWYYTGTTAPVHSEVIIGGMAIRPGSGEVVVSAMDPLNSSVNPNDPGDDSTYTGGRDIWWSGGIRYLDNRTGKLNKAYVLYQSIRAPDNQSNVEIHPSTFFKSSGLGDIEYICENVPYIEVGNRIWLDKDRDGIQDANEPPVAGVQVSLYRTSDNTLLQEVVTDAQGQYLFNIDAGITENTRYRLVIGKGQYSEQKLTLDGKTYLLTKANSGEGNTPDLNDSDFHPDSLTTAMGGIPAGLPFITFQTGPAGYVNHTFDAGLVAAPLLEEIPDQQICVGNSFMPVFTFDKNGGKPTYQWYNDNGPANPTTNAIPGAADSVLTQLPTAVGIYHYKVLASIQVGNLVLFDSATVVLTLKAQPELVIDSIVCSSDQTLYSIYYHAIPDGVTVQTTAGTVQPGVIANISSGTDVVVTATLNGCATTKNITAPNCECLAIEPPVSLGDKKICEGQPIPLLAVTVPVGQSVNWYDAPIGGNLLASGTSQFQSSGSGTFYAAAFTTNGTSTCYSFVRTAVKLTVNPQPRITASAPEAVCQPGTINLNSISVSDQTGTTLSFGYPAFYNSATDAYLNQNPLTNTLLSQPMDKSIWIRWQTSTGCFDTTSVRVVIHPKPVLRVLTVDCAQDAKSYSIRYAISPDAVLTTTFDNTLGTKVLPGIITGIPIRQTITLLATSPFNCTELISVESPACPCPPIGLPHVPTPEVFYCEGNALPELSAAITDTVSSETIYWYDALTGGNLLAVGNQFTPTQAGTYYAEARDTISLCLSSARVAIQVKKVPKPVLTILDNACAPDGLTYEVTFDTLHVSAIQMNQGVLQGTTIREIPQGTWLRLTVSNAGCSVTDSLSAACVTYGSIGDLVWFDSNGNGLQDEGEPPFGNVKVQLLNDQGSVIRETFTSPEGKYLFDNLATGVYQVKFFKPGEYVFTNTNGADPLKNSDVGSDGKTALISINTQLPISDKRRNNPDIDAGLVCPQYCIPFSVAKVNRK